MHTTLKKREASSEVLRIFVALVIGLIAIVLRAPHYAFHPQLYAEEGIVYYVAAFEQGIWRPLLGTYGGYLTELPHLLTDLALIFPLRLLPKVFFWEGALFQALPMVLFSSKRYERVVHSYTARLAFGALWIALPYSQELYSNVTNAHWSFALCILLVFLALPKTKLGLVGDFAIIVVGGLSGPFGILILIALTPLAWRHLKPLARAIRDHKRIPLDIFLIEWGTLALVSCVQAAVILLSPRRALLPLGASTSRLIDVLAIQIGAPSLFGLNSLPSTATTYPDLTRIALAAFPVVLLALGLIFGNTALRLLISFSVLEYIAALKAPLAAVTGTEWAAMTHLVAGGRYADYVLLAIYITELTLLYRAFAGLRHRLRKNSSPTRNPFSVRDVNSSVLLGASTLAILAVFAWSVKGAVVGDFRLTEPGRLGYQAAVAKFDRSPPGARVSFPESPTGWVMVLQSR